MSKAIYVNNLLLNFGKPYSSNLLSFSKTSVLDNKGNMSTEAAKPLKIGTHDGMFHCDEVLACYMLKLLPLYKDAEIVRTRDLEKLKLCDIVVDVGAVFDHSSKRYDHHQREFQETLGSLRPEMGDNWNRIRLSSAGLIYTYYGEECIQQLLKQHNEPPLEKKSLKLIYKKVYNHFIEEIDAIDNGVPMCGEEPKYKIHTHLSARVSRFNPEWNTSQSVNVEEQFSKGMKIVSEEFVDKVLYYSKVWLPARDLVKDALGSRFSVHDSGEILLFSERFPWKEHLFDLEQDLGIPNIIKYTVFIEKPGSWRVQAVPVTPSSFVCRKFLHKDWLGVRDAELSEVAGIPGCIFVHTTGFIGGNQTKEGALNMAIASLEAE